MSWIYLSLFVMILVVWIFYSSVYKSLICACSLLIKRHKSYPETEGNVLQHLPSPETLPQALNSRLIKLSSIPECALSFLVALPLESEWCLRLQIWASYSSPFKSSVASMIIVHKSSSTRPPYLSRAILGHFCPYCSFIFLKHFMWNVVDSHVMFISVVQLSDLVIRTCSFSYSFPT